MSKNDVSERPLWLTILIVVVSAATVWLFVDPRTTSLWVMLLILVPGILVGLAMLFIFASPSLEVSEGVISARRPFGKTIDLPISQIVSVHKVEQGFSTERLIIRGLRDVEIVLDRKFDEEEINAMLAEVRAARPDLHLLTEGLWSIKP